jgi:hypothetical protein
VKNLVFDKDTGEIFDTGRTLATEKAGETRRASAFMHAPLPEAPIDSQL